MNVWNLNRLGYDCDGTHVQKRHRWMQNVNGHFN